MKLLSPSEARDKAKRTVDAEKQRLVEVQALLAQKHQELASVEATFDETLQKQRNLWAAERMEHEAAIVSLRKTTEALEDRKRQALLPLTQRAKELDTKATALDAFNLSLDEREDNLHDMQRALESRLDEVAERELQATKVATMLALREEGIQAQAAQVVAGSASLNAAIAQASSEATDRERALTLKEAALKAKEGNLEERERKVNATASDFDRREAALRDERATLTKAAQELNKQHGTK